MSVLIFEGADLVGKSTLARQFSAALGYPIVKLRWDLIHAEAETVAYAKATIGLLAATRPDVILDRSYLSMWAYAEGPPYMAPLVAAIGGLPDARLVVLTTEPNVLRDRYRQAPDDFYSESRVLAANDRFVQLFDAVPCTVPKLHLDTATTTLHDCCRAIDVLLSVATATPLDVRDEDFETVRIEIGAIPVEIARPRNTQ